jgi:broad specificity phosphatase PhoE
MIILVRHGETEWNVERRFQGQKDSALTARGLRQAQAMASLVRDLVAREDGAWRLLASPLKRAHDTAGFIARATGLPLQTDARLAEVHCGDWEGLTWDEVVAVEPRVGSSRQWIYDSVGGETFEDVHARIAAFLADLPAEPERRVIAVTHGAAGRVLRGAYAGLDRDAVLHMDVPQDAVYRLQNGQIDRFDCEPVV